MPTMIRPYFALPSGTGMYHFDHSNEQARTLQGAFPNGWRRQHRSTSLLAYTFNLLYADALNNRWSESNPNGVTHFLMLHDDIIPHDNAEGFPWSHDLFRVMLNHNLGVVSAVVPIKDKSGDCSTAIEDRGGDVMGSTRYKLADFPLGRTVTSVDEPGLLINSGCMAIDLTKPWSERLYFHVKDGIRRLSDGTFQAWVDSEDWNLSRMLRRLGVKYGATAAFRVEHIGLARYESHKPPRVVQAKLQSVTSDPDGGKVQEAAP